MLETTAMTEGEAQVASRTARTAVQTMTVERRTRTGAEAPGLGKPRCCSGSQVEAWMRKRAASKTDWWVVLTKEVQRTNW